MNILLGFWRVFGASRLVFAGRYSFIQAKHANGKIALRRVCVYVCVHACA